MTTQVKVAGSWKCDECDYRTDRAEDDVQDALYRCESKLPIHTNWNRNADQYFTSVESEDMKRPNLCPECGKAAKKVTDYVCPECRSGVMVETTPAWMELPDNS